MAQIELTDLNMFYAEVSRVGWSEELWNISHQFFQTVGVRLFSYHHLPPLGAPDMGRVRIVTDGYPERWVRSYIREKRYRIDPIPMQAMASETPFRWSEIRELRDLSATEAHFLDLFFSASLGDGLAVQAFGPGGRNGYFGLGFGASFPEISPAQMRLLQSAAQIAHLRYCRILRDTMPAPPVLSERERELLHWVAQGKSNGVIAEIMKISPHTVDAYLRRVFLKLGTSDRISAAVRGLSTGVIRDF